MFPFLCTPILAIHLLAQKPFKESNACSKRPSTLGRLPFFSKYLTGTMEPAILS